MNLQEAFNVVWQHAKKLQRSTRVCSDGFERCAYRGADGAMCFVGVLMPTCTDLQELNTVWELHREGYVPVEGPKVIPFLEALQNVHDNSQAKDWEYDLCELADRFDLEVPV